VVGGDHPFLSRELVSAMADAASRAGAAVVPRLAGRYQPLHAVYPTESWRKAFRDALDRGDRSPSAVLKAAVNAGTPTVVEWDQEAIESYDPGLMSLIDVDTPTQLARARNLVDWRVNVRPGLRPPGGA
jgi:molybdopterin-guanine dinucleotide biosynthesis protein A